MQRSSALGMVTSKLSNSKIRKNTQIAKFIQNLAVITAKFIWNLAVLIVEPLFGFTANTRFSYKLFLFKLRLAKFLRKTN